MKKAIGVFSLVLIIAIPILAVVYGYFFVNWNSYKEEIGNAATNLFGCSSVSVGDISGSLLSSSVSIDFMAVGYSDQFRRSYVTISATNIQIGVSPLHLLVGKLRIKKVALKGASVSAEKYSDLYEALNNVSLSEEWGKKIKRPRLELVEGDISFANSRNIREVSGIIDFDSEEIANLNFLIGSKSYKVLTKSESGNLVTTIGGPDWIAKYSYQLASQSQERMGKIAVSGTNAISLVRPIAEQLLSTTIHPYVLDDRFDLSGTLLHNSEGFSLQDVSLESNYIKGKASATSYGGHTKIILNVEHVDVDKITQSKLRTLRRNGEDLAPGILAELVSAMQNSSEAGQSPEPPISINVAIDDMTINEMHVKGARALIEGSKSSLTIKQTDIASIPGSTTCQQQCVRSVADTQQCEFTLESKDLREFLAFLGVDDQDHLIDESHNILRLSGTFDFEPQLINLSEILLSIGSSEARAKAVIKLLRDRSIARGQIVVSSAFEEIAPIIWRKFLKILGSSDRHSAVVMLNTIPIDFQFKTSVLPLLQSKAPRVHFDASYRDGALSATDIHIYDRDKVELKANARFSATELRPRVVLTGHVKQLNTGCKSDNAIVDIIHIVDILESLKPIPNIFDGKIVFDIDHLCFKGREFTGTKANMTLNDGSVRISELSTNGLRGSASMRGSVMASKYSQTMASIELKGMDLGAISNIFLGKDNLYGFCSMNGAFSVMNNAKTPWTSNVSGAAQWAISDMRTIGFDLKLISEYARKVRNESELASLLNMTFSSVRPFQIGNITGSTKLQGGVGVSSFSISGNVASGTGIIQVLLANMLMNGLLKFNMTPVGASFPISIEASLKGSATDYDVIYNFDKIKKQIISR